MKDNSQEKFLDSGSHELKCFNIFNFGALIFMLPAVVEVSDEECKMQLYAPINTWTRPPGLRVMFRL